MDDTVDTARLIICLPPPPPPPPPPPTLGTNTDTAFLLSLNNGMIWHCVKDEVIQQTYFLIL